MAVDIKVGFTGDGFSVDWGDGSPLEKKGLNGGEIEFEDGVIQARLQREYSNEVTNGTLTLYGNIVSLTWLCYKRQLANWAFKSANFCDNPCLEKLTFGSGEGDRQAWFNYLDVSQNTELKYLNCCENRIQSLDLSNNVKLEYLSIEFNEISYLDLSENINLKYLNTRRNDMSYDAFRELFESLHDNDIEKKIHESSYDNEDADDEWIEIKQIAEDKGWEFGEWYY